MPALAFCMGRQEQGWKFGKDCVTLGVETKNEEIMGKFINPFTDVGFKLIFGQEINKDLLIDFLNSLLEGGAENQGHPLSGQGVAAGV